MLALAIFAMAVTVLVHADPSAPSSATVVQSSGRDLSELSPQAVDAQGGNVTEININALTVTTSWQGYYGDVTGTVILQDANNNTFYNWSLTSYSGRVFATRSSTITWSAVNCTNATARATEETYLGQTSADSDSVTNTYNLTTHPSFQVGSVDINADSCFSTFGYVDNASQSTNFAMVLLQSGANIIYTTLTNQSTNGFNGEEHDFQLLVGENEKSGNQGVTTYYFWTEFT
jgi:hypothetical protein